ncbi:MAG: response regulator transcription factor [Gammaproteobacteria bacterium]|nr:response regulator transcription factor [Gammaproteobacteria bacterium]
MNPTHRTPTARLLLVDDDPVVLHTLLHGLRAAGYDVVATADPHHALLEYTRRPPDLAVLDIGLPGLSGTQLAVAMLQHLYRPILILSGHSEAEHVRAAVRTGVMGYLVKPVAAEHLIPSIETARARFADLRLGMAKRWHIDAEGTPPLSGLLDQLAFGLMVIDRQHSIVVQNRTARRLLDLRTVLSNRNGKLVAVAEGRASRLHAALECALGKTGAPQTAVLPLPSHHAEVTYQLLISPSTESADPEYATAIIVDPYQPTPAPAHILKALYGLTTKESRLAQALLNGDTLDGFCTTRFVSPNTARTQLKSIYQKTGTNRQVDLVRTLSKLFGNVTLPTSA